MINVSHRVATEKLERKNVTESLRHPLVQAYKCIDRNLRECGHIRYYRPQGPLRPYPERNLILRPFDLSPFRWSGWLIGL